MKKFWKMMIAVVLGAVLVVSGVRVGEQMVDYDQGEETYRVAAALVELPAAEPVPAAAEPAEEPRTDDTPAALDPKELPAGKKRTQESEQTDPYVQTLEEMDLEVLREQNPDVVGWIVIPDTQLSYPLMKGTENDYYLNHTWLKEANSVGSIFLEYSCAEDFSDFNTIIYGHRMKNGSMFATLKYYAEQEYFLEHPSVYVVTDEGVDIYDIFAAYEADVTGHTYYINLAKESNREIFVNNSLILSEIDTEITPSVEDKILTLSTCTGLGYDSRWVVQAVLRK